MEAASRRHALVTGGGRGIGRAIAASLAALGLKVSVVGRDEKTLEAVVAAGDAQNAIVADVTDRDAVRDAIARAERDSEVDILVNNVGGVETGPFLRLDDDVFERQLALNLLSTVRVTRAVLPGMVERGFGRVINIASTAGLKAYPYASAYVAAKHAVLGFTRALALEMAKSGVTVNAICPGYTDTDLVRSSVERIGAKSGASAKDVLAKLTAANPQGRLVHPQEVACVAAWLVSERAASVTGQAIAVDGGETVS
ncbi:MAG: SDR family oxidoreductase [Hyphomicrobiales bacterium]|nr:SDR family oxidoreductase [Hyphomicrobiales bacterium]MBV9115420.1 SDR family oxidoreductase [Hyphomicrobiales bacterium]MBV9518383.1 SDR family oxidoreductase [Hyphomicrobiales bacterium]